MEPLDSVVIRGYRPLRSLALLACSAAIATVAALYIYVDASGSTLVTFKDYGYAYFLVPTTAFVLVCIALVAIPPHGEEIGTVPYFTVAFALAVSALSGYMAGLLYFSIPLSRSHAYITRDGTIHRGEHVMHTKRMYDDGYVITGWNTPRVVPVAQGHVALLGFRFSYTVSDEMILRSDIDFDALATKAAREIFGPIAAEKSRGKRLAALAEHRLPMRRGEERLATLFCERLEAPCPFRTIDMNWTRTADVPNNHWSDWYSVREAVDEERVKIAIGLLGSKISTADRDSIFALVLAKGTTEEVVSVLWLIHEENSLYEALAQRALTEKLEHRTLINLGTQKVLRKGAHRKQARARMFDEVPPSLLVRDRERDIRMSVEEANAYGEKLLGGGFTDDDRARILGAYHWQLMNPLAHRLAYSIRGADAASLMRLITEPFLDETLRDKAVEAIARAQDSAIVKAILQMRSLYRDANAPLTRPEMDRVIAGFLENASDPKWFAAITNHADVSVISKKQAQALAKKGLGLKIPEVFRIAFEPEWSSVEEAQEIMRGFLAYADKYDCLRALRMDASVARERRGHALASDIRAALEACAGDQLSHLKRRN